VQKIARGHASQGLVWLMQGSRHREKRLHPILGATAGAGSFNSCHDAAECMPVRLTGNGNTRINAE
jgi:hypothetical protein